jgi:hypothetical protein
MKLEIRLVAAERPIAKTPHSTVNFNSILGRYEENKGTKCPVGNRIPEENIDSKEETRKPTIPAKRPRIRASTINVERMKVDPNPRAFSRPISDRLSWTEVKTTDAMKMPVATSDTIIFWRFAILINLVGATPLKAEPT